MKFHKSAVIGILFLGLTLKSMGWFSQGYARAGSVPNQLEIVARLNSEAQKIAEALVEADLMHGTHVSVFANDRNANGFEIRFDCSDESGADLSGVRASKVQEAVAGRYEELIKSNLSTAQIKDPAVSPVREFLARIRKKG